MLKTLYIFNNSVLEGVGVKLQKWTLACILIIFVKKAKQKNGNGNPFSLWFPRGNPLSVTAQRSPADWWPASL